MRSSSMEGHREGCPCCRATAAGTIRARTYLATTRSCFRTGNGANSSAVGMTG